MSSKIKISPDHDGRRLDKVLRAIFPNVPLSALMRALRKGEVRLDAKCAREPDVRVGAGQELYVPWDIETENERKITNGKTVPYIWKDDDICVVNKPAGLLVQPDTKGGDSVITRVWSMCETEATLCGRGAQGFSPAAVHRLDRNTTGLLVVAMSGAALRELEQLFRDRKVRKTYLAIVVGQAPESGEIKSPLLKDEDKNFVSVNKDGKSAHTRFEKICSWGGIGYSVVSVELLTGRTHQARVHLASVGFPILGDQKYGNIEENRIWWKRGVRRPLLHAWKLEWREKSFTAPPPGDMEEDRYEQSAKKHLPRI